MCSVSDSLKSESSELTMTVEVAQSWCCWRWLSNAERFGNPNAVGLACCVVSEVEVRGIESGGSSSMSSLMSVAIAAVTALNGAGGSKRRAVPSI